MGGLKPRIYLSKNAGVMLTCNLWTEVGLCNGEVRTVLDVINTDGCIPPTLPVVIIVQFDEKDYSRPSFCTDILNCVPIVSSDKLLWCSQTKIGKAAVPS